jgi:hypothetical protein
MYALSKSAPVFPCRFAVLWSAALLSCRLTSLSSGVTLSFVASATACLFEAEWSVIIVCAKSFTAFAVPFCFASAPAVLSIEFTVTTMWAICASVGFAAGAVAVEFAGATVAVELAGATAVAAAAESAACWVSDLPHAAAQSASVASVSETRAFMKRPPRAVRAC